MQNEGGRVVDLGFRRMMIGTHIAGVDLEEGNTDRIAAEVLPLVRRSPLVEEV